MNEQSRSISQTGKTDAHAGQFWGTVRSGDSKGHFVALMSFFSPHAFLIESPSQTSTSCWKPMFYIHQEQKGEWRGGGRLCRFPFFCKGKRCLQTPMMFRENRKGWLRALGGERREKLQLRGGSPQTTSSFCPPPDPLILFCTVTLPGG